MNLSATAADEDEKAVKDVVFKNNAPFKSQILKINKLIDNSQVHDIVMLIYNLMEYSHNCSMTSKTLWSYYRDKLMKLNLMIRPEIKIVGETSEKSPQPGNLAEKLELLWAKLMY